MISLMSLKKKQKTKKKPKHRLTRKLISQICKDLVTIRDPENAQHYR